MVDISPLLINESFLIGKLSMCHVLLRDDHRFPWVILVPDVLGAVDLDDLAFDDQQKAMADMRQCAHVMKRIWKIEKINMASIGNIVSQCHIHVVGRRRDDCLWPLPVWGMGERQPYDSKIADDMVRVLKNALHQTSFGLLGTE